jgi:hypothetical protein
MADTLSDWLRQTLMAALMGGAAGSSGTGAITNPQQAAQVRNLAAAGFPGAQQMVASSAAPSGSSSGSWAPAIETGLGGLAGLLDPHYGPMGRRSWAGQIGGGIQGALGGYDMSQEQALRQSLLSNQLARTQQAGQRIGQTQQRIGLAAAGTWRPVRGASGNLIQQNDRTGETRLVLDSEGKPIPNNEAHKYTFTFTNEGLVKADRTTGEVSPATGPGGERYGRAPSIARSGSARAERVPADMTRLELAEARREWMADSTDPTTGLPKEDAPSFDDWLTTEWPKRRAAISGSESGAAAAAGSAPGSPGRSRSPVSLKGRPVGTSVTVPGMGEAKIVRYEGGRAVLRFPDGSEFRVKE